MTMPKVKEELCFGLETLKWIELYQKHKGGGNHSYSDLSIGQLHLKWEPDLTIGDNQYAIKALQ